MLVNTSAKWSSRDHCAQGIMFTFAHLVASAIRYHGNALGQVLKQPLTAQCIITNGFKMSLLCYQLNTLDLRVDSGVKNIVWLQEGSRMFEKTKIEKFPGQKREQQTRYEPIIEGFNEDVFRLFTRMLLNGVREN